MVYHTVPTTHQSEKINHEKIEILLTHHSDHYEPGTAFVRTLVNKFISVH